MAGVQMHKFSSVDLDDLRKLLNMLDEPNSNVAVAAVSTIFFNEEGFEKMKKYHEYKIRLILDNGGEAAVITTNPAQLAAKMSDAKIQAELVTSFLKMAVRDHTCDTFEFIRNFCKEKECMNLMVAERWFEYARVVRNALRHNRMVNLYSKKYKSLREVEWDGAKIPLDAEGQKLTFKHFGPTQWDSLHAAMKKFAEDLPSKVDAAMSTGIPV